MRCPYQKKIIHKPSQIDNSGCFIPEYAEDITVFGECLRGECPYYQKIDYKHPGGIIETCRKVESEVS